MLIDDATFLTTTDDDWPFVIDGSVDGEFYQGDATPPVLPSRMRYAGGGPGGSDMVRLRNGHWVNRNRLYKGFTGRGG